MKICEVQASPVTTYSETHCCRCWLECIDETKITVSGEEAALEDSMAGSHFYPDFAAVLLKQKVAEQQIAIQSAQIDQKKAQIEYDAAAEKQEKGQELAKIDGVVTKVAASVESLEKNEPYLVCLLYTSDAADE